MAAFGQLIMKSIELHFAEQDAAELRVIANAVARRVRDARHSESSIQEAVRDAISGHHDVYFRLYDSRTRLIYASLDGPWSDPPQYVELGRKLDLSRLHVWTRDSRTYRSAGYFFNAGDHSFKVVSAVDIGFHLKFLAGLQWKIAIALGLGGMLTILAAWYGVHQAHAPLRRLEEQVIAIGADRLHTRLPTEQVPRELQRLVHSFNEMIGRLDQEFKRVNNFADDIAHELRTPLTNLVTQTQVALAQTRSVEEYRDTLYSGLEEYERLTRMVNDLLWLAKSEHGLVRLTPTEVDLAAEVRHQIEFFGMLAEERGISLRFVGSRELIGGDREMLRRALSNLLSNALAHTPRGGVIRVRLEASGATVTLTVENDGDVIATEHLPRLFDRFYQVDSARRKGDGIGLGLAIVKSIAECHGGTLRVSSEDRLTCFSLSLPRARAGKRGAIPKDRHVS